MNKTGPRRGSYSWILVLTYFWAFFCIPSEISDAALGLAAVAPGYANFFTMPHLP